MPPRKIPPEAPHPEPTVEPPYYEATQDLYVGGDPEAAAPAIVAYRAGDRVVPDVVEANGWGGQVRVPDVFHGQLNPIPAEATAPASEAAGKPGTEEK